jgi:hypothetical protein
MCNQLPIDFSTLHHQENNIESQRHFEANKERFSKQCRIVFEALLRGERLTTTSALINYGIGDLRRRIKDLKDTWKVDIKSDLRSDRFKEFYL